MPASVAALYIVSDGWSIGVLLDELGRLYSAQVQGPPDPPPPPGVYPVHRLRPVATQRAAAGTPCPAERLWQRTASARPRAGVALPTGRGHCSSTSPAMRPRWFSTPPSPASSTLGQRHGVTLYMTLLAAWAAAGPASANQSEVVVGSPVAGRNRAEIEGPIGFVNTLALRIELDPKPPSPRCWSTFMSVLEAQAHQDLPFDQVVEAVAAAC